MTKNKTKILVTGSAGFIGFHFCKLSLENKNNIIHGIDNLNNYYDKKLKMKRISILKKKKNFFFFKMDINSNKLERLFKKFNYDIVINLAAQAGVRYSIYNPNVYFNSNVKGFFNLLDNCRKYKIKHLLFASTSSVYGNSKKFPLKENYSTDKPLSFYAATKKTNETMAFSYSAIYKIPITTLRFFTVFGPLGRPDMSLYKFTNSILKNKAIDIYNYGNHVRDFTYVDDVVKIIQKLIKKTPKKDIPFEIYNIASSSPKKLKYFIKIIEKNLKKTAKKNFLPLQTGDVYKTHASINKLKKIIKVEKITPIEEGISRFVNWFKNY